MSWAALRWTCIAGILWISSSVISGFAQASLNRDEVLRWMSVGEKCEAPLIRIVTRDGNFEVYIESPEARAAIVSAAATMNHQPLDASRVMTALRDGYRIWVTYTDGSSRRVSVSRISLRTSRQPELQPIAVHDERLFVGIAPSHGLVEAVRARFPEFEFPDLPSRNFTVVLHTSAGLQQYAVTDNDGKRMMRVCNDPR